MAKRGSFRIEGLRETERALRELPKATAKGVLKRVLLKASNPLVADWTRRAPVLRGFLQRSIGAGTKLSRRQKGKHRKESSVEVFVGAGSLPQAITQEFGTAHHAAKPAGRPAWDANKRTMLASMKSDLKAEIEKARARLARKAARLAAKMKAGV
jgi:HK97 gp10 family phage protein